MLADKQNGHPSIYYTIGALFVVSNLTIAFARFVALGSDYKTWYIVYFIFRFVVEVLKLAIVFRLVIYHDLL